MLGCVLVWVGGYVDGGGSERERGREEVIGNDASDHHPGQGRRGRDGGDDARWWG